MDSKKAFASGLRSTSVVFCLMIYFLVIQNEGVVLASKSKPVYSFGLYTKIESLQKDVQGLTDRLNVVEGDREISLEERRVPKSSRVAFYAQVRPTLSNIGNWSTIVFPHVITNKGGHYNSSNGTFVAPINGIYVFYVHILSERGKVIATALKVNNDNRMFTFSGGHYLASGSNMAVLELKAGDVVYVVKTPWGKSYVYNKWSTFSGFFLFKG